jgi:hypothetical protein
MFHHLSPEKVARAVMLAKASIALATSGGGASGGTVSKTAMYSARALNARYSLNSSSAVDVAVLVAF